MSELGPTDPRAPMPQGGLDERRLELEIIKTQHDYELRKLELAIKQRETGWGSRLFSPLTTTLLAGILTLAATSVGTLLQGRQTLQLEAEKQQHELVLKMIAVSDPEQSRQNLQFLADTTLITVPKLAKKILESKALPLIPPPAAPTASSHNIRPGCTYDFVRAPSNPTDMEILGTWEQDNIVAVEVPQLVKVTGGRLNGVVRFNKLAAEALKSAWLEIEQKGLLDRALTWDGAFTKRFAPGGPSAHACGTAFDINAQWNAQGARPPAQGEHGSVVELVPIFEKHGFRWGGKFVHADGMHFEFIVPDAASPVAEK